VTTSASRWGPGTSKAGGYTGCAPSDAPLAKQVDISAVDGTASPSAAWPRRVDYTNSAGNAKAAKQLSGILHKKTGIAPTLDKVGDPSLTTGW
jgi:hypothetical protein